MADAETIKIPKVKHDGELAIAVGRSRFETAWKNKQITWSQLVKRLSQTKRTSETYAEYQRSTKSQRDLIKDVGGFVGGSLKQGRRKAENVANRTLLTLDMDEVTGSAEGVWDLLTMLHGVACVMYSTHSHTPESPRLRLVIPLARPVMGDEYQAIARALANDFGIDQFDDTTYEPHRLMYWPSTAADAEFVFRFHDRPWLDPDEILKRYPDWRDVSYWPESSRQTARITGQMGRQEDPLSKRGIVGAFCRAYPIEEAISTFLADVYVSTGHEGRYTYAEGTGFGGVVIYEDRWVFSHHATDPASGLLCNAFDLVRIHKFSDLDDDAKPDTPANRLPSYIAMSDFAARDDRVKTLIGEERMAQIAEDFDLDLSGEETDTEWLKQLAVDRKGKILSTIDNALIILENDPLIKGRYAYDEFAHRAVVRGKLPWNPDTDRDWADSDDAGVRHYIEEYYGITGAGKIADAVTLAFSNARFHPVRDYLEALEWDGTPRVDTLLIDYLGAEDTEYTRIVTRKWLCGAVARVLRPGIKFDYMLVLTGPQGCYKSTFLRLLARDWFTDSLQDVEGTQAVEKLMGSWIVEFGELQAFSRSESNAVKRFVTSQEDRTRLAYDKRTSYLKRQCVFAGTTNKKEFLKDDTGNRRYWPVEVRWDGRTKHVIRDLPKERDQIWAEAVVLWRDKREPLYLDPVQEELAWTQQEAHREHNEKEGLIVEYLDKLLPEGWENWDLYARRQFLAGADVVEGTVRREKVCILEIWCECFGKSQADLRRGDSLEIAGIMNNIDGWRLSNRREYFGDYGRQRCYERV